MGITFSSKSAKRSVANKKKALASYLPQKVFVAEQIYIDDSIIWIGEDVFDLFSMGKLFNFNCVWLKNQDLSVLIHAKCLIASYVDTFGRSVDAINFAYEHDIPILWLNRFLPPYNLMWSFCSMSNEKDATTFWEHVCRNVLP